MIENLRVGPHKALAETQLSRLGIVTVVCGKNNSGKSTLLEAIDDKKLRSVGRRLDGDTLDALFNASLAGATWLRPSEQRDSRWRSMLAEVGASRPLWFADNDGFFASQVEKLYSTDPVLRGSNWGPKPLQQAFVTVVAQPVQSVLVPPKRNLLVRQTISTNEGITPSGGGVLNYLFYAVNQPPGSAEYRVHQTIADKFYAVTDGYRFTITPDKNNQIGLYFARDGSPLIAAADCGLGLQDVLVILFFAAHPEYNLILIEEPESHLHPDVQRRLLLALREISGKQYVLSTHSNVFLNSTLVDLVLFTSFDGAIRIDDATSRAAILNDLGYSVTDNLVSDLVILVEGPTDTPVVEELLLKRGLYKTADIKTWPLGGDIMDQLDLAILSGPYRLIGLVDSDPKSGVVRQRFERKCRELNIPVHVLKRYAIENYFSLRALREVFGAQIPDTVTDLDPDRPLEDQINFNVKRSNRRLAQALQLDELDGTDLAAFLDRVAELVRD